MDGTISIAGKYVYLSSEVRVLIVGSTCTYCCKYTYLSVRKHRHLLFTPLRGSQRGLYACSKASVFVHWSQTSLGPQYWMGPG